MACAAALGLGGYQGAAACAFHGYTPNPTLVDVLLSTEQVVIARLDPANPRRFVAAQTLMGPDAIDIPLRPKAATRARLTASPGAAVLLARDGAYGAWLDLAVLDARYQSVVTEVVARQSAWVSGAAADRLALFAGLVNDPNPDLRRLALQELDRVPYSALKSARLPKINTLSQQLRRADEEVLPILILLAGLSGERGFAALLRAELDKAIRGDAPYLGAYATALIELEGTSAVEEILHIYLRSESLSPQTQAKLLDALALQHKTAERMTRRDIERGVAALMRDDPTLREVAARQFGFRNTWRLAGTAPVAKGTAPRNAPDIGR